MTQMSKFELLINFGFKDDPFKSKTFKTGDTTRIQRILEMAVKSNAMVSIVGERGMGKTQAINTALKDLNARPVMVRSADKSRLLISDIEQAMIIDLSEEKPKRGREIRARQLRRVLGEASRRQKIVVVIEEGHRLHGLTLRAIKTLRELDWMGETELFSIVLLGQSDPMHKAGVAEVRLRSDSVHMTGLTGSEIAGYIEETVGLAFENEAIEAVARLPEARNFLDLQKILLTLMSRAASDGRKQVSREDVISAYGKDAKRPVAREKKDSSIAMVEKSGKSAGEGNSALKDLLNHRKQAV